MLSHSKFLSIPVCLLMVAFLLLSFSVISMADNPKTGEQSEMLDAAYQEGYIEGYSKGYQTGKTEGRSFGYAQGEDAGLERGYEQGYDQGYEDRGVGGSEDMSALLGGMGGAILGAGIVWILVRRRCDPWAKTTKEPEPEPEEQESKLSGFSDGFISVEKKQD